LNLTPLNWNPANASDYLTFSWNYLDTVIEAGSVLTVTQTLSVASPFAGGFSRVTFDVLFESLDHLLADVTGPNGVPDGKVDIRDLNLVAKAYGSFGPNYFYPGSPASENWNPLADLNGDGKIDARDVDIVERSFGLTF
jgi:hypothetical protein